MTIILHFTNKCRPTHSDIANIQEFMRNHVNDILYRNHSVPYTIVFTIMIEENKVSIDKLQFFLLSKSPLLFNDKLYTLRVSYSSTGFFTFYYFPEFRSIILRKVCADQRLRYHPLPVVCTLQLSHSNKKSLHKQYLANFSQGEAKGMQIDWLPRIGQMLIEPFYLDT